MTLTVHPLLLAIAEGEGQRQDFKQSISDATKIARTLAAFANCGGGRLLVGVKDNGRISGTDVDEEGYMIDLAANMRCTPPVPYVLNDIDYKNLKVLEVVVPPGAHPPYRAPDDDGKLKVYIRVQDRTQLASPVMAEALRQQHHTQGLRLKITSAEQELLALMAPRDRTTLTDWVATGLLPYRRMVRLLGSLIAAGLLLPHFQTDGSEYYTAVEPGG